MSNRVSISASILAADHAELGKAVARAESSGCDELHIDVMDGKFAPNLGFSPATVAHIREWTKLPLEVHMMVKRPMDFIQPFAEAGVDIFCVHAESEEALTTIHEAKRMGLRTAVALLPETAAKASGPFLSGVERVLVLSVNPGFSGQRMIPKVLPKAGEILQMAEEIGTSLKVAIDGGVNSIAFQNAFAAGFRVAVSGGFLFDADNMEEAVAELKSKVNGV